VYYGTCTIFYNEYNDIYIVYIDSLTGHEKYFKIPFNGQAISGIIKSMIKQFNPSNFEIVDNAPEMINSLII
jgi:streptogramin lyase